MVELSPGQAETVINATALGKLSLALRSIVDFPPVPGGDDIKRNAPIRLIRYGQDTSVMTGTAKSADDAGTSVDPATFRAPTVSVGVSPLAD